MKRILVTGGEGFIGSHIVNELCQVQDNVMPAYTIISADNLSKYGKERNVKHKNYIFCETDILSSSYSDYILDLEPHVIIDLASIVGGINKINNSNDVVANINIFNQTFEVAKQLKNLEQYIFFSSSIVYDRINTFPTPELSLKDIPIPNSPYGYYKYTCEYLLQESNLPWTVIRPYNCIGIGDDNEDYAHVFTDFIRQAKRNGVIKVKGGNQYRSFIDCEDVAEIIESIIYYNNSIHNIYNIGNPSNYLKIKELAYKICDKIQNTSIIIEDNPNEKYDVKKMLPNINTINKELCVYPHHTLEDSLDKCIEYYN
jgi:nucleoside-diphosphate-sugar epimerase